jgi:hypothetical protein
MSPKTDLHNFQDIGFDLILNISYFLLFISYIGISESAPKYLDSLDYYIRVYTCLFLIWRFNPLRSKYEFTDLDRKIAFSAGVFVLTTTALNTYFVNFKELVKNAI